MSVIGPKPLKEKKRGPFSNILPTPYSYILWAAVKTRAVDPHSFFADPDPAAFLNSDPDPV